jgi:archaeosine synthase beta-subunit
MHDSAAPRGSIASASLPSIPEVADAWPESKRARDRFVLARRPPRVRHDPARPQGALVEAERTATGTIERMATVFLVGRECPWRCVMCDLWTHTLETDTPAGAIPRQLDVALAALSAERPAPTRIKLYNAGSFFDPRAVPVEEYDAIASRLQAFSHVVVESHPSLVGERVDLWLDALARSRTPSSPALELEIAMGLETAHPEALARLHKGMTLAQFAHAAHEVRRRGATVRAFVLVPPPFVAPDEETTWLRRSIDFAFESGASVVSLVPTRTGNGALDALAHQGLFRSPRLVDLEAALAAALPEPRGRVFADLWDLERLTECETCLPARRARLQQMNLEQIPRAAAICANCEREGRR